MKCPKRSDQHKYGWDGLCEYCKVPYDEGEKNCCLFDDCEHSKRKMEELNDKLVEILTGESMSDLKPVGVKAPLNLLPLRPLRAISAAMQHGALKYEPWNWTDPGQAQARIDELHAALLRHSLASSDPTQPNADEESGLHHLAHAGACIVLLLYKMGLDYEASKLVKEAGDAAPDAPEDVPGMGTDGKS